MRALTRLLLGGALAAGTLLTAAPATAENCVGDNDVFYVCATTPQPYTTEITRCVYVGGSTCQDVTVPFVGLSGEVGFRCGGRLYITLCDSIIDLGTT